MLRNVRFIASIVLLSSLAGCTSIQYVQMKAVKSAEQEVVYNNGKETLVSKKSHYVTLAPFKQVREAKETTAFVLFVYNLSAKPVNVSSDIVSVEYLDKATTASTPIKVLSYNDMIVAVEKEEEEQRRAAAWAAAAGAINASTAAYSSSSTYSAGNVNGTYNANTYGNYGRNSYSANTTGNYNGSYSGYSRTTTYDPAKAQALANQNSQQFKDNLERIAANAQSNRQLIEQLVLKPQTVPAEQSYGGLIVADTRGLDHKNEGQFRIVVDIEGEQHIFTMSRTFYPTNN